MEPLVDPSAILAERYRSERAALEQLMASPRGPFARAHYWLGRLWLEIVFDWLAKASMWFAAPRRPTS
jgi:hypothetical protein